MVLKWVQVLHQWKTPEIKDPATLAGWIGGGSRSRAHANLTGVKRAFPRVGLVLLLAACGSRTGLFGTDDAGSSGTVPGNDGSVVPIDGSVVVDGSFADVPGLDVVAKRAFLESLLQNHAGDRCTVLYCSHQMEEIERVADNLILLERGRLLAMAAPDELCARVTHWGSTKSR